jgi:predicted permease
MWTTLRRTARSAYGAHAFAVAVVVTIALAAGATSAAWAVFYGILLKPLPFPDPDRLITLGEQYPGVPLGSNGGRLSNVGYHVWTDAGSNAIGPIVLYEFGERTASMDGSAARIVAAEVSPEFGAVLGAQATIGRWFGPSRGRSPDAEAVLSDTFWAQHFNRDPAVVGRSVTIEGRRYLVVGVADPRVRFPASDVALWIPFDLRRAEGADVRPNVLVTQALARLKPGSSIAFAEQEGTALLGRAGVASLGVRTAFGASGSPSVRAFTLKDAQTMSVRPALHLIAGAVLALYLIACANLASLFVARGTARQREIAIRRSIGATQAQLVTQTLYESLFLSVPGAALGLMAARLCLSLIQGVAPHDTPRLADADIDAMAVVVALIAGVVTTGLTGLLSIVGTVRRDRVASEALAGRTGAQSLRTRRAHNRLLAAEAACATVVLVFTVLLATSVSRLLSVDAGYTSEDTVIARVFMPGDDDATSARRWRLTQDLLRRVRDSRGVVAAGATNMFPFDPETVKAGFPPPGEYRTALPPNVTSRVAFARTYSVTPGYGEALRLRLLSGRLFIEGDAAADRELWVVNKEFARLYLPPHPVGRLFPWTVDDHDADLEIIGVVENVLKDGLDREPQPEIYNLIRTGDWGDIKLVIRTTGRLGATVGDLRPLLTTMAPDAALDITPLERMRAESVSGPRFMMIVIALFSAAGVGLACGGLYAVLMFNVSQRRHELAIRMALGATARQIVRLVMDQALRPSVAGVGAGLAAAACLAPFVADRLFKTAPLEPMAYGGTAAVLVLVAAVTAAVPALRATETEPNRVLRAE